MWFLLAAAAAAEPCVAWEPAEVSADFDGDGKLDRAVQVRDNATAKVGIQFELTTQPGPILVGAGVPYGSGRDDLAWVRRWSVRVDDRRAALLVDSDRGGGGLRWNGKKFVWKTFADG